MREPGDDCLDCLVRVLTPVADELQFNCD